MLPISVSPLGNLKVKVSTQKTPTDSIKYKDAQRSFPRVSSLTWSTSRTDQFSNNLKNRYVKEARSDLRTHTKRVCHSCYILYFQTQTLQTLGEAAGEKIGQ